MVGPQIWHCLATCAVAFDHPTGTGGANVSQHFACVSTRLWLLICVQLALYCPMFCQRRLQLLNLRGHSKSLTWSRKGSLGPSVVEHVQHTHCNAHTLRTAIQRVHEMFQATATSKQSCFNHSSIATDNIKYWQQILDVLAWHPSSRILTIYIAIITNHYSHVF